MKNRFPGANQSQKGKHREHPLLGKYHCMAAGLLFNKTGVDQKTKHVVICLFVVKQSNPNL